MRHVFLTLLLLSLSSSCATSPPSPTATRKATAALKDPLKTAVLNPSRPDNERTRDTYRHPYETLAFFQIKPDHHVLELWSGRGWYTHILAPYLAERGKLHVTAYSMDDPKAYRRDMTTQLKTYLSDHRFTDKVNVITVDTNALDFGLDNQLDAVLTFRNIHNWVKGDYDKRIYTLAFKALKPGGTFGVVEHRGPKGMTRQQSANTGYMDEAQVIADIEAVGFKLVERSEINANPKDTKDHPKGVWTLPPALRLGDTDRAKYTAIGESDRMTLRFVKP